MVSHGYRNVEEHAAGVIKLGEKIQNNSGILFVRVSWDVPDATSLFLDYVTVQGSFTGHLSVFRKSG